MEIKVSYHSLDGCQRTRSFKTLEGARRYAAKWVGATPEISVAFGYAVSDDGIGKISVRGGATITDLFPGVS